MYIYIYHLSGFRFLQVCAGPNRHPKVKPTILVVRLLPIYLPPIFSWLFQQSFKLNKFDLKRSWYFGVLKL